ncbi:MAG TPA: divalent-cation tolerance protein CutA [Gammaproteobacteria bacterium]|nr:divalent-cation tolerance protein CutA [Gammaproteobacteria bacterium]
MEKHPQLIFCTCPDRDCAQNLANTIVEQRLAACVSILPGVHSIYHWQGKQESADEILLLIKTHSQVYPALERLIQQQHPYELPEIIAVPVENGLPAYLNWISEL